jgi:VanZ family protein
MKIRLPFAGEYYSLDASHPVHFMARHRRLAVPGLAIDQNHLCGKKSLTQYLSTIGVFFLLVLLAGYAGLTSLQVDVYVNDKVLHFVTFFVLTVVFYWILDTNRRRTLNLTLMVCTLGLGVGSEFLQHVLPNNREFDIYDVLANIIGSLAGVGLCSWYHKRMLERKRQNKHYTTVAGEDPENEDLELGERSGSGVGDGHEEGVVETAAGGRVKTLEEEVDTWDENALDAWDEDDLGDVGTASVSKSGDLAEDNGARGEPKTRSE